MKKSEPKDSKQEFVRSHDFRYIPSDAVSVALSEAGAKIIFGVEEVNGAVSELIGVHMSLDDAEALQGLLNDGLKHVRKKISSAAES